MFSILPLRRDEVYVTVLNWSFRYEPSLLFHVLTPLTSAYCSWLYMSGANGQDQVIVIAKTENLVLLLLLVLASCRCRHTENSFRYT